MRRALFVLILLSVFGTACGSGFLAPRATQTPTPTDTPTPTSTITLTPTPTYPLEGLGPSDFPSDVNPLTGLEVSDPALLDRRPLAIKISNLPRNVRPQWGLSLADIVFEYYTEEGSTRFTAIFYGNDAEQAGPIRSARFLDFHIIRAYKAVFAFGSADQRVLNRLYVSDFANRLVLEWQAGCPPMCRFDPNGMNLLLVDTAGLSAYATRIGIANKRQKLDGMFFQIQPPRSGQSGEHLFTRYSAAIYNRWDYDPITDKYLRFSEKDNDLTGGLNEVYEPLTDRLTEEPLAFDNVVVVLVAHEYYSMYPEMVSIPLTGSGIAHIFRDGMVYRVNWQRPEADSVLSLTYADGTPFPFKPGTTWFEVMGTSTEIKQVEHGWRFTFHIP